MQDFFEVGVDAEVLHVHGDEIKVELVEHGVHVERDARFAAEQGVEVRARVQPEDCQVQARRISTTGAGERR